MPQSARASPKGSGQPVPIMSPHECTISFLSWGLRTGCNARLLRSNSKPLFSSMPRPREHCNPEGAEIPFDVILDRVTGSDPSVTDYVLEQPAKCPNSRREILETTLIEPT
jgi:hypothetical protein